MDRPPSRIRWRYGTVDEENGPPIVLQNLPVCGNCHSFADNGSVLGLDVDYGNDKGAYGILPVSSHMVMGDDKIITWADYKREDGELTFGLLSRVSPTGRYVISTVKDRSVFVAIPDLMISQLFFPIKGILVVYDREKKTFKALPGADEMAARRDSLRAVTTALFALPEPYQSTLLQRYFENLSPDSESDYFCAGITEDILTDLSKIKGLRVAYSADWGYAKVDPEVRRVVWAFLEAAGLDSYAYRQSPHDMVVAAAIQDNARWWLDAIRSHCPEREAQMRADARKAQQDISTQQDNDNE